VEGKKRKVYRGYDYSLRIAYKLYLTVSCVILRYLALSCVIKLY